MPKRYTVTAALPYTNGPIHIGHLAGVYIPADIYSRYLRLQDKDVAFICGSDEHGVAIALKAKKEGKLLNKSSISTTNSSVSLLTLLVLRLITILVLLGKFITKLPRSFLKFSMTKVSLKKKIQNNYTIQKQSNF
jgi:leucyl-tRNA synthetase